MTERKVPRLDCPEAHRCDATTSELQATVASLRAALEEAKEALRRYTGPAVGDEPVAERDALLAHWQEERAQHITDVACGERRLIACEKQRDAAESALAEVREKARKAAALVIQTDDSNRALLGRCEEADKRVWDFMRERDSARLQAAGNLARAEKAESALEEAREALRAVLDGVDDYWAQTDEGRAALARARAVLPPPRPEEGGR